MYTVVYALYKKDGMSREEFTDYWLNVHRPIAMRMPNVRGYEIWPVTASVEVLDEEIDGFVILRFDSKDDFDRTHESAEFAATAEDAGTFTRHYARYVVETHEVICPSDGPAHQPA